MACLERILPEAASGGGAEGLWSGEAGGGGVQGPHPHLPQPVGSGDQPPEKPALPDFLASGAVAGRFGALPAAADPQAPRGRRDPATLAEPGFPPPPPPPPAPPRPLLPLHSREALTAKP